MVVFTQELFQRSNCGRRTATTTTLFITTRQPAPSFQKNSTAHSLQRRLLIDSIIICNSTSKIIQTRTSISLVLYTQASSSLVPSSSFRRCHSDPAIHLPKAPNSTAISLCYHNIINLRIIVTRDDLLRDLL